MISVYNISNITSLCHHTLNTNDVGAFEGTTGLLLNQSVIKAHRGSQNEKLKQCVPNIM